MLILLFSVFYRAYGGECDQISNFTKDPRMDITEFEKMMQPLAKKSKLDPFDSDIMTLKQKGYAHWQIAEFLKLNGVAISREGVRKFIASREAKSPTKTSSPTIATHHEPPASTDTSLTLDAHQEKLLQALQKKRQDADKQIFKHDPTGKQANLKKPGA